MGGRRVWAATLIGVVALGLFFVWYRRLLPPLTGDEPGYMVVAESIWYDHDLNLANNYGVHARISGASPNPVEPSNSVRVEASGEWRATQPIGMGLLLTPAVAIGHRGQAEVRWARRLMIFLAAVLVWQLFELLAAQVSLGLAAAITAGVAVAFPLVGFSNELYPEIPAALLFTIGLRAVLAKTRPHPFIVGLTAAALPWFSLRFLPLAIGLVVALAARELRSGQRALRPIVVATGILAAGFAMLVAVDADAVFHANKVAQSPINTYRIGVGGLLSPIDGLLPFAPQLALGVVGLGLVMLWHRWAGVTLVVAAVAYEFAAIPFGFRGYALPARFQVVLIPLLALGIACLLRTHPRLLALFAIATIFGLVVLVQAGSQPTYGFLYLGPSRSSIPVLKPLANVLPDFSLAPGLTSVNFQGSRADHPPPVALRRGTYDFALHATSGSSVRTRIVIDTQPDGTTQRVADATRTLSANHPATVAFSVPRSGLVYRFHVEIAGVSYASARVRSLSVRPTGPTESRITPTERGVPLGLGYMVGVLILIFLATRRRFEGRPSARGDVPVNQIPWAP